MCGIAGIVTLDSREPVEEARLEAHARRAAPPRAGRRGAAGSTARSASPIGGWRSSTWPAATSRWRTRTDASGSSSTARSTTTPRSAPGPGGARPPLPHAQRHRDDPPPLRGGGRALRRAAAGHVRVRALGPRAAGGCCWRATASASSRSTTRVTGDELLFASEIKALLAGGRCGRASNDGGPARVPGHRLRRPARRRSSRASQAAARARRCRGRPATGSAQRRYWRLPAPLGDGAGAPLAERAESARAARGGRAQPPDERRAARRCSSPAASTRARLLGADGAAW